MASISQRLCQPTFCIQPSTNSDLQKLGAADLSSSSYHSKGLPKSFQRATCRSQAGVISNRNVVSRASSEGLDEVTLLDYGAGNVRSVRNAIKLLGYKVRDVEKPSKFSSRF